MSALIFLVTNKTRLTIAILLAFVLLHFGIILTYYFKTSAVDEQFEKIVIYTQKNLHVHEIFEKESNSPVFKESDVVESYVDESFVKDPPGLNDIVLKQLLKIKTKTTDIFSNLTKLDQDDTTILNYVLKNHLYAPPQKKKRVLSPETNKGLENSDGFPPFFVKRLPSIQGILGKMNGFFIEVRANDGEYLSNTIGLEVVRNWTGLLIEPSPELFAKMRTKLRNAWLADVCLSGNRPEKIHLLEKEDNILITNSKKPTTVGKNLLKKIMNYESEGIMDCFPLYSLLSAINVFHVDYLYLNVEGNEFKVLDGIPYDRLRIDIIQLKHRVKSDGKDEIKDLLISKGYRVIMQTQSDYIFLKQ